MRKLAKCWCNSKNATEVTRDDGIHAGWCGQFTALLEAAKASRSAIMSLPEESLGRDVEDGWFYRNELLSNLNRAIAAAEQEGRKGKCRTTSRA